MAEKREMEIRVLEEKERKILQNAKIAILAKTATFTRAEIAEKLDILEVGVEVLKNRGWTFWDCLSIADKLNLELEIVFRPAEGK